jgi:hypothetical protein
MCNTGEVFINSFFFSVILSIEKRVFVVEYVFREGNIYSLKVYSDFPNAFYNRLPEDEPSGSKHVEDKI